MFNLAVDCALENPSVFTPTVDEKLTMFVSNIRRTHSSQKRTKDDTACPQLATSMYAALTLVKIYKKKKRVMQT